MRVLTVLLITCLSFFPLYGQETNQSPADQHTDFAEKRMGAAVMQDGRIIQITNHAITIRKAPFSLLFAMTTNNPWLLVNFSLEPNENYDPLRFLAPLSNLDCFGPGKGMLEQELNAERTILLKKDDCHLWFHSGLSNSRFDTAYLSGGMLFVERRVEFMTSVDDDVSVPVSELNADALYVCFIHTDAGLQKELERNYFEIDFLDE